MNASELALSMLEWEDLQRKADELAVKIEAAVLEIGKTQTVGNETDYAAAWGFNGAELAPEVDIEKFAKVEYDYKAACAAGGIDTSEYSQQVKGPSVTVKLVGKK